MNEVIHIITQVSNAVLQWGFSNHLGNYWTGYAFVALVGCLLTGLSMGRGDDWDNFVRRASAPVIGAFVWPVLILVIMAALTLALPAVIVLAWFKKLPSREQRRAKAARKVETLRAERSELA